MTVIPLYAVAPTWSFRSAHFNGLICTLAAGNRIVKMREKSRYTCALRVERILYPPYSTFATQTLHFLTR